MANKLIFYALMAAFAVVFFAGCSQTIQPDSNITVPQTQNIQSPKPASANTTVPFEQMPVIYPINVTSGAGQTNSNSSAPMRIPNQTDTGNTTISAGVNPSPSNNPLAPAMLNDFIVYIPINGTEFVKNLTLNMPKAYYFRETNTYMGYSSGGHFWYKDGKIKYEPSSQPPGDTITFLKKNGKLYIYSKNVVAGTYQDLNSFSSSFGRSSGFDELTRLVDESKFADVGYLPGINNPTYFDSMANGSANQTLNLTLNLASSANNSTLVPAAKSNISAQLLNLTGSQNTSGNATGGNLTSASGSENETVGIVYASNNSLPEFIFQRGYFYMKNQTEEEKARKDCVWYMFVKPIGRSTSFCMDARFPVPLEMQIEDVLGMRYITISGFVESGAPASFFDIPPEINMTQYMPPRPEDLYSDDLPVTSNQQWG